MKKCQIFLSSAMVLLIFSVITGCSENREIIPGISENPVIGGQISDASKNSEIPEASDTGSEFSSDEEIPPEITTAECTHNYIIIHSDKPLCEISGNIVYSCEKCKESFTEEIPAKNHDYVEQITLEATDFSSGIITYTCSDCEKSYCENYSLGHSVSLENGETATVYGYWDLQTAQEILKLLNTYRCENNLCELRQTEELSETAQLRALECAQFYSHTRPNGARCFTAFPTGYALAAENVGAGFDGNAQRVMEAWINSPEHNKNLLNPDLKFVGISLFVMTEKDRQKHGGTYFSQEFIGV